MPARCAISSRINSSPRSPPKTRSRIMQHFAGERCAIARGDVGQIGNDQVEQRPPTSTSRSLWKRRPGPRSQGARAFSPGERERVVGNIDGMHFGFRKLRGQGERDDATAGADIEQYVCRFPADRFRRCSTQLFRFGTRDERALVAEKNAAGRIPPFRADAAAARPARVAGPIRGMEPVRFPGARVRTRDKARSVFSSTRAPADAPRSAADSRSRAS